jgi:hypothetical protein
MDLRRVVLRRIRRSDASPNKGVAGHNRSICIVCAPPPSQLSPFITSSEAIRAASASSCTKSSSTCP